MLKRNMLIVLATSLLLLGILGCINYEQEIEFNPDLSGKTHVHYWVTGTKTDNSLPTVDVPLNEEGINEEYSGIEGLEVSNVVVEEKDGETHCEMDFTFKNFDAFLKTELGNFTSESYFKKNDKGNFEFLGVIEGEEADESQKEMLSNYVYKVNVKMPGSIIETNGEKSGNTAKWDYKLSDIVYTPRTELKVVSEEGGGFSLTSGRGLIILIIIIIIIVIIIVVIIIASVRAKKKE